MMNPDTLVEKIFRLTVPQKRALKKLGIATARDLLFHFPARYGSTAQFKTVAELKKGDEVILNGHVRGIRKARAFRKKIPLTEAVVEDHTGRINVVWFHQPYIEKLIRADTPVQLKGRVGERKNGLYIANPEIENIKNLPLDTDDSLFRGNKNKAFSLYPVYPESRGITSRWFYHALKRVFRARIHESLDDPIPKEILKQYHLPTLKTALVWIHNPKKEADAMSARKRFSFEEIFFIQLSRLKARENFRDNPTFKVKIKKDAVEKFTKRFPFSFTGAQEKAVRHILDDFQKKKPMSRLLEGDVGSGKTAVAATTAYTVVTSQPTGQDFGNLQVAIMAPTEILARQHFESFIEYFSHLPIQIGLITGSTCRKFPSKVNPEQHTGISRGQLLKRVANGEIPILIGTHSLIQKTIQFKHLAYVIIDEQHRFGTMQRLRLARKEKEVPHLLSMTATPIPRTLALTIYGDLDLTLLDEMPPGRKPIITEIVLPDKRNESYKKVTEELKQGRQVYVICPKIEVGRGKLEVKNVTDEAKRLKEEVFPNYEIEILHSRLKPKEREEVMERFARGKINILVATSVVEVGVNIPNATTIIIEGADRFGLAQLHQLRGRVLRSTHQARCYIFSDTKSVHSIKRLKALKDAKDGFELAELDLTLRGPGELSGKKQWGISDIGMEAIRNIKMVEAARVEAQKIISSDPELKKYYLLKERVKNISSEIHFE